MKNGRVSATLLLVFASLVLQVSSGEDLYWEGDDDSNEFLEVKEENTLQRLKRQLFWPSFFDTTSTTKAPEPLELEKDDTYYDDLTDSNNDVNEGSGFPDNTLESEPTEKTLRVTFVVMEPYHKEYSSRDMPMFQNLSRTLADAVNLLYEKLPGTQRASLVRIQSRLTDELSCKVTLDIVTTGYEDTDNISNILLEHIKSKRSLGTIIVSDSDFSAQVIDPETIDACTQDEVKCNDGLCVPESALCDGRPDCSDGSDERNCPTSTPQQPASLPPPLPLPESNGICAADELTCEDGSCVPGNARCDGRFDCPDQSDEADCPLTDGGGWDHQETDDTYQSQVTTPDGRGDGAPFGGEPVPEDEDRPNTTPPYGAPASNCAPGELVCDEVRCVSQWMICDGNPDCNDGKDEANCPTDQCGADDFRCSNNECIESSRRCDGIVDCPDQEDELNCQCRDGEFQCADGSSCIEDRKRCDGVNNCKDGSDEFDCNYFRCSGGIKIPASLRCNSRYDCPSGDFSDEHNCRPRACPADAFTCPGQEGRCAQRCDGNFECPGGEDEDGCPACYHRCDGRCLDDSQICNQVPDCSDGTDEIDCNCEGPDDFRCSNGDCLSSSIQCNGIAECDDGSDEEGCAAIKNPETTPCTKDQFQCGDGTCINNNFVCDGQRDCSDSSDEESCGCSEGEWQCTSGQCIPESQHCDSIGDCDDNSDESNCATPGPFPTLYPTTSRTPELPPVNTAPPPPYTPLPPVVTQGPVALNLKTYPDEQTVRYGGDVVFQCRDEGPLKAPVRWIRQDGRPLPPGSFDRNGRLEMNKITTRENGVYVCQAPRYLRYPNSEVRVTLTVEASPVTQKPIQFCQPNEATCGNGQCIPMSAICDGRYDCADRSDEDSCNINGKCEPNSFRCDNKKCVLKTWLCDAEDDCGDGSDERNCGPSPAGEPCLLSEFACSSNEQCIPKSFHCDGESDCMDRSDEIGCAPMHVTKPPQPSNLVLNPGETLVLQCEAVGVPTPLITWRLNWGHIPDTCTSTSVNGVGVLTCTNMQHQNSGAYSCEALNNKGSEFASPNAIVFVNQTGICRNGYFNSEARTESECVRCFCFGESTQCRSADLFTYNMPTPLGEGGTRLVGVRQTFPGEIQLDSQPINDQYYYQPQWNGAAVTKLETYGSRPTGAHPYLTLPESYNGNQLTSYGGHIKYRLTPHNQRYGGYGDGLPDIVIRGKYQNLVYNSREDRSREKNIEARFTPGNWQKTGPGGLTPATREDIMMALDNVEMILLRADVNGAGVNISDFVMESAQHFDAGLGPANLVEECTCPPGYEGLSCQKCAEGYIREKSGPWLGHCVREEKPCPPGTYGSPNTGYGCRPCPCPLTNAQNQFARTCHIGAGGGVVCDCEPGYEGSNCEYCAAGYVGNPLAPGDSCKPKRPDNCNPAGTSRVLSSEQCECKDNVQGRYCDQCKSDSFYLSENNRQGCALCFCSGVSQQCTSSDRRRKTTSVTFNVPQIVDQVKVYSSAPSGLAGAVRYNVPVETQLTPRLEFGEAYLSQYDLSRPNIYYWSLPASFGGDKVTAYGGKLSYALRYIPTSSSQAKNTAADVQLLSDNRLTFHYFGNFAPGSDGYLNATVPMVERGWRRSDGKEVTREHFLLALADVNTILVKATYTMNSQVASLVSASIETAEPNGNGPTAVEVEQCFCPTGYVGTSCEDCAPGYTRSSSGLYLEHCGRCDCNGHSNMCHPETGVCYDCADNTAGDSCEQCKPGYERDAYQNCVKSYTTSRPCNCDPRGAAAPCDDSGHCACKQNVEGSSCDQCRPGTFGLDAANPDGCISCYCSAATTECHEASHYSRIAMPAPIIGEDYGGYKLTSLNDDLVINDQFVATTNESELTYIFSEPTRTGEDLYWSLPSFPGNRILSYGGFLVFTQTFQTGGYPETSDTRPNVILEGDQQTIYWTSPEPFKSGESKVVRVPLRETGWHTWDYESEVSRHSFMDVLKNLNRVLVRATLSENIVSSAIADVAMDSAIEGSVPGAPPATGVEVCMCPEGHSGTSCEKCNSGYYSDVQGYCRKCNCNGHNCQLDSRNEVVCNCRPPYTGPDCSTIAGSDLTTRTPPLVPPPNIIVTITSPTIKIQEIGSSVNFTCQAQSRLTQSRLPVTWNKDNGLLPLGRSQVDQRSGALIITNLQISDSGRYICQTSDGISTAQAEAILNVPGNPMTAPSVQIPTPDSEYYEGDRVELQCIASGNPTPRISWQRSANRVLPLASQSYQTLFIIDRVQLEDAGEYSCIASNEAGTRVATALVRVRPRPSEPTPDKLTVSPSSSDVMEGQSTRVVCTGTANVPPGAIGWIRQDGTELLQNVRSENGVLYIDIARLENQGVYVCQTSAPGVSSVPVLVSVQPISTPSPAERSNITVSVSSLTIPAGETGTVECNPQGRPLPLIRWKKYEGEFGPGTSQRGNTLIISNAQKNDKGYYLCEGLIAEDSMQQIYVYVDVEPREAPEVEIWPNDEHIARLEGQYMMQCRILKGIPDPVVTWNRNGNRPLSPHTEILQGNTLNFQKVEVNDEGEYTCTAANSAGSSSATALLKVRSEPEITITPRNFVEVNTGEPINVECRANGYPQPLVSIKSMRDYREVAPPTLGIAALRVPAATESDGGQYTCTATNDAGSIDEEIVISIARGDGGTDDGIEGSGENEFFPTESPGPGVEPQPYTALEGSTETTIQCETPDGSQVLWTRNNGQPLQRNAEQIGNTLIIRNPTKSDSGYYECTKYNSYTGEQSIIYTNLKVVTPIRITLRPPTQIVYPRQSPTVECVVEGDGLTDIYWKPVDKVLSRRVETRGSTLIFHQIELEDAGHYECIATSPYANASGIAEVIVNEDVGGNQAGSDAHEQTAHIGAMVRLSCNATSNVRITWTKNGRALPRSVQQREDGSLLINYAQKSDSGLYVCHIEDRYRRKTSNYINLHIEGASGEPVSLVTLDEPGRVYRAGEDVAVMCRVAARENSAEWQKLGTNQFVESRPSGDGSLLVINGVQESDVGVYRCVGRDPYGASSYVDYTLQVQPEATSSVYPDTNEERVVSARLRNVVDLPCEHNLEQPVQFEWRREYTPLASELRTDQPSLHLESVTEGDAGTYVCRVSNRRVSVEARVVLRVLGVVPRFAGHGFVALPTIKDAYKQFDIEISFNPADDNGLILYNSENQGRTGDYLALRLVNGIPQFILNMGPGPIVVVGDRPLQLNTWHTIRLSRMNSKVTMDVDNSGPFAATSPEQWDVLDLHGSLYVGGVPDYAQLPEQLAGTDGFIGCVGMLILGREEKNVIMDSIEVSNVNDCDVCTPNLCLNGGVCQEARNERGFTCLCATGWGGPSCERAGEACRPGICGPGRCTDTPGGYRCACPLTYTGKNCDVQQYIEYPAFTGSAFLAIKAPKFSRLLRVAMRVKASAPVADGIIMYCAESPRGHGGFTSLAVHDGKLEFRYDLGDGSGPTIVTARRPLHAGEWTDVYIARVGADVTLRINTVEQAEGKLSSRDKNLHLETPMFVGGVDDSITLNPNTGVTGGFSGCITDVKFYGNPVNLVNSSIISSNVQECSNYDRGDIPELETICRQCRNGGRCQRPDSTECTCPSGFTGPLCERRAAPANPCALRPCRNEGLCRINPSLREGYTCDCPLGWTGNTCQNRLELLQSVGFSGNGFLELPSALLRYDHLDTDPALVALAFNTREDGVLFYQRHENEDPASGDHLLLRVDRGLVVLEWVLGGSLTSVTVENTYVNDGERHPIFAKIFYDYSVSLSVDGYVRNATAAGYAPVISGESNIYIGGMPDVYNVNGYPGFTGCFEQVEMMGHNRGLNLGKVAVTARNAQKCREW